jgi:hypothetical protein
MGAVRDPAGIRRERGLINQILLDLLLRMQWLYQQKDAGRDDQSNQNFVIYHGSRLLLIAIVVHYRISCCYERDIMTADVLFTDHGVMTGPPM